MAVSEYEKRQIEERIKKIQILRERMTQAVDVARERIAELKEQGFFLEVVFINSQIIEKHLKVIISFYSHRRRILILLGARDIYADVALGMRGDVPLGDLIATAKSLDFDDVFIERLQDFNTLRKDAIHRLFDGRKEIKDFNETAKDYFAKTTSSGKTENEWLYLAVGGEYRRIAADITEIARTAGLELKDIEL